MGLRVQVVSPMMPAASSPIFGVFVENIVEGLKEAGCDVEIAAIHGKRSGFVSKLRGHGELGLRIIAGSFSGADITYVHAPSWFSPLAAVSTLADRSRLVVHLHGGEVFPFSRVESLAQPMVERLIRRADLVISPSRYFADLAESKFGISRSKIFVSPSGGVDLGRFEPIDKTEAKSALNIASRKRVIGYAGRIERDKGWDTFLEVLSLDESLIGLLVGGGAEATEATELAKRLGVGHRLYRFGLVPQVDLPRYLAAMDLLLFPTRGETEVLGLTPIEAMAMGIPVLGSNAFAVPEYVEDGSSGFLCEASSAGAFADGVRQFFRMPMHDRNVMRRRARLVSRRYEKSFVAEALVARMTELA